MNNTLPETSYLNLFNPWTGAQLKAPISASISYWMATTYSCVPQCVHSSGLPSILAGNLTVWALWPWSIQLVNPDHPVTPLCPKLLLLHVICYTFNAEVTQCTTKNCRVQFFGWIVYNVFYSPAGISRRTQAYSISLQTFSRSGSYDRSCCSISFCSDCTLLKVRSIFSFLITGSGSS